MIATANTYSYLLSHSFEACVGELAEAGFMRVEAMIGPGHLWPDALDVSERKRLRRFVARLGIELVSLNQPNLDLNVASLDPPMREHSVRRFADAIRLAADLGCPRVVVGPGKANPLLPVARPRLEALLAESLDELVPLGERLGIRVLLENMPFAFLPSLRDLLDVVSRLGSVGLVYDVANGWFIGEDPSAALVQGASVIELVHVSDTTRDRYAHAPIGVGTVPWREVGRAYAGLPTSPRVVAEIVSATPSLDLPGAFDALREFGWPVHLSEDDA